MMQYFVTFYAVQYDAALFMIFLINRKISVLNYFVAIIINVLFGNCVRVESHCCKYLFAEEF